MKFYFLRCTIIIGILLSTVSCTVDNIEDENKETKTDYSTYNYVLATEDASTADITRFFSFNMNEIDPEHAYDLIDKNDLFENSDPSTSSGYQSFDNFIFSMAKDKRGFSSTPGIYRLTLNTDNRIYIDGEIHIGKDNLFPARRIALVDEHTAFFYNESSGGQLISKFDPTTMQLVDQLDLRPFIKEFRPDAEFTDEKGSNLVRTGSLVMDYKNDKLYVSIVFLEKANFNLISEDEENFYLAVIDIPSFSFDKIIQYPYAKTVGFYVSENNPTSRDQAGNLYFDSWGWNQFYSQDPSRIFRIKADETKFDLDWMIDIEELFGKNRIAQSMIAYNGKIYLHISLNPYTFSSSETIENNNNMEMGYYAFDIDDPDHYEKLDIPNSDPSSRMNVFSIVDDKLFIAVPNSSSEKFNGLYVVDKEGKLKKGMTIQNKYRPTRLYKLEK